MQEAPPLSHCPSFNCYFSDKLAEVAAIVSNGESEASLEQESSHGESPSNQQLNLAVNESNDEAEFEFDLHRESSQFSSDQVFHGTQIRPIFPLFNRQLLLSDDQPHESDELEGSSLRIPLKQLFNEERDAPSCSSSEADELEGVQEGTYCVWRPKSVQASPSRCKKSNSAGSSSKRWLKLRDLLRRSNSDGKDSFVFVTASSNVNGPIKKTEDRMKSEKTGETKQRRKSAEVKVSEKAKAKGVGGEAASAHELFYVRNRALKEGDKRRSFLPYRKDLVGLFASAHGLTRNFPL